MSDVRLTICVLVTIAHSAVMCRVLPVFGRVSMCSPMTFGCAADEMERTLGPHAESAKTWKKAWDCVRWGVAKSSYRCIVPVNLVTKHWYKKVNLLYSSTSFWDFRKKDPATRVIVLSRLANKTLNKRRIPRPDISFSGPRSDTKEILDGLESLTFFVLNRTLITGIPASSAIQLKKTKKRTCR